MSIEEGGSLAAGLAFAVILLVYFIEVLRARDTNEISFFTFAAHLVTIGALLLGGGEVAGSFILTSIASSGSLAFYLIGLNGLFVPLGMLYYIARFFLR